MLYTSWPREKLPSHQPIAMISSSLSRDNSSLLYNRSTYSSTLYSTTTPSFSESLLAIVFQMPGHDLFEDVLAARLDHVAVARDQPVKIPTRNRTTAAPEPLPIALASHVPDEPLLPQGGPFGILKAGEELGQ